MVINSLRQLLRHHHRPRPDHALLVSLPATLMASLLWSDLLRQSNGRFSWPLIAVYLAAIFQPLLLLRLAGPLRPFSSRGGALAVAGLVAGWILALHWPPIGGGLVLLMGSYLALFAGRAAVRFRRQARPRGGIILRQAQLFAAGSILTALAVAAQAALAGGPSLPAWLANGLAWLVIWSGGLAMLAIGAGLLTPRWLRRAWQQEELYRFLQAVVEQRHLRPADAILADLCPAATRVVGAVTAVIARPMDEGEPLRLLPPPGWPLLNGALPTDAGLVGQVWADGRARLATKPDQLGPAGARLARATGAAATLLLPVEMDQRPFALLLIFLNHHPRFVAHDLALLRLLADQTALLLSQRALLLRAQTARQYAESLAQNAASLGAHADLETTLAAICKETTRALDVPTAMVALYDEATQALYLVASHGLPASARRLIQPVPRAEVGPLAPEDEPFVIHLDWRALPELPNAAVLAEAGIGTIVQVNLMDDGQWIGRFGVATTGQPRTFTADELAMLRGIAAQTSLAIRNGRLFRQVRQQATELEQRVAERTADLQARNDELDAFAHTVAHDLKGPAHNIRGYVELLQLDPAGLDAEQRLCLENIGRSVQQMDRIIDNLLLLAQVRDAGAPLEPVDMARVMGRIMGRLQPLIADSGAQLIQPANWPVAYGYEPWLEEVWINYLTNGIKYGGQPPRLILGAAPPVGGQVRFWVRDNGPGLRADEIARLFKPFSKLQHANGRSGHGLGLSIVERIVARLGGQVGVDSDGQSGSEFWFTLPATVTAFDAATPEPTPAATVRQPQPT